MFENNESFIYIKNDDEVNLKTCYISTDHNNCNNSIQKLDLSDANISLVRQEYKREKNPSKKTKIM